jgi:hypothetical protein
MSLAEKFKNLFRKNNPPKENNSPEENKNLPPYKQLKKKKFAFNKKTAIGIGIGTVAILGSGVLFLAYMSEDEEEDLLPKKPSPVAMHRPLPNSSHIPQQFKPSKEEKIKFNSQRIPHEEKKASPSAPSRSKMAYTPHRPISTPPQPKKEIEQQTENSGISGQFVGAYVQKAINDLKIAIKRELEEAEKKKKKENQNATINLEIQNPNIPTAITVEKIAKLPDGTIMVFYRGKWYAKGMELTDGWIIENIDDKYIYLRKTFNVLEEKENKVIPKQIVKHAKVSYIVSY